MLTAGNIFTPSDNFDATTGDAAEFSAVDGATVQTLAFAKATKGDILPSGIFALAVEVGATTTLESLSIYSAVGELIAAVTSIATPARSAIAPVFAWGTEHFFILVPPAASGGNFSTLYQIQDDGTIVNQWTLPENSEFADNMAISVDGAICYYGHEGFSEPIRAYDLVGDAPLANLVAASGTVRWGANFLITADGDLLVPAGVTGQTEREVRRYSSAGALVATYTLDEQLYEDPELFTDPDPAYFWARTFPDADGAISRFWRIHIETGAVERSFEVATLEGAGVVPSTCPNLLLRGAESCELETPSVACWDGAEQPSVALVGSSGGSSIDTGDSIFVPGTILIPGADINIGPSEGDEVATVIDADTGEVVGTMPALPPAEYGDNVASGVFALMKQTAAGGDATHVNVYNPDATLIASVALPTPPATSWAFSPMRSNGVDWFYFYQLYAGGGGDESPRLRRISTAGVLDDTVWVLPEALHGIVMAVSRDDAIAYVGYPTGSYYATGLARWDLVNDVQLADLIPQGTYNRIGRDIVVTEDGDIIGPVKTSLLAEFVLMRWNSAGVLQQTYTLFPDADLLDIPELALDHSDPSVVWLRTYPYEAPDRTRFTRIDLATGDFLTDFTIRLTEDDGDNVIPLSCPFIVFPAATGCELEQPSVACLESAVPAVACAAAAAPPSASCWSAHTGPQRVEMSE